MSTYTALLKQRCARLLLALVLLMAGFSSAHADTTKYDVKIVAVDKSEGDAKIADVIAKAIPGSIRLTDSSRNTRRRPSIYLTVGPVALKNLIANPDAEGVVVALFSSSLAFRTIVENRNPKLQVTAIFAEPSPLDQMRLITLIHKRAVHAAVLVTDKTEYLVPLIRHAASQTGIRLAIEHVGPSNDLNSALRHTATANVLLAVPDPAIYNPESIRNILTTSYRNDVYVVGYSPAMVRAGALATVRSSVEDTVRQAEEITRDIDSGQPVPEPQYPKYFGVEINEAVANSLNVLIDEKAKSFSRAQQ